MPGGRASPADFTAAATALLPFCSGPRRPSFIGTLCEFRLCRGTLLCNSRRPSFPSRLHNRIYNRRHFCRGTVLCDPKKRPRLNQQFLPLLQRRRRSCHLLRARKTRLHQKNPSTSDSVLVLHCAIPRGRTSPASLSTAVPSALVASSALGQEDNKILAAGFHLRHYLQQFLQLSQSQKKPLLHSFL